MQSQLLGRARQEDHKVRDGNLMRPHLKMKNKIDWGCGSVIEYLGFHTQDEWMDRQTRYIDNKHASYHVTSMPT